MEREYYKEKLINSSGNDFEKKSQEILNKVYKEKFIKIKPYGNIGDRKNDGYIPSEGKFFQIFGPEEYTSSSEKQAIFKFENDLLLLEKHSKDGTWVEIKEFCFIYNDKDKGISPKLEKLRIELEESTNIHCRILKIQDLMDMYDRLSEKDQKELIGYIERPQNDDCKVYEDLKEKFFSSGLIDKLDNFVFGNPHDINYFDFKDGTDSSDYINYYIDKDPYYIFKNKELEELRIKFCENYLSCMHLLAMNYFISDKNHKIVIVPYIDNKVAEAEEFEKAKTEAVWALKTLLREFYKNNN